MAYVWVYVICVGTGKMVAELNCEFQIVLTTHLHALRTYYGYGQVVGP